MIRRVGWRGKKKNRTEEYNSVAICCLKIRFKQRNSKRLHTQKIGKKKNE